MNDFKYEQEIKDYNVPWLKYVREITAVSLPEGLTRIGERAFVKCANLTAVTIPNSVTSLGRQAFVNDSSLSSITIPKSVTSIDGPLFWNCVSLTSVVVDPENKTYNSRGNCNAIIETSTNKLIAACNKATIPAGVKTIGEDAFGGCGLLASITIPNSVSEIEKGAFYYCKNLTSITIPNSVKSIGYNALSGCVGLRSVTFPKELKKEVTKDLLILSEEEKTDSKTGLITMAAESLETVQKKANSGNGRAQYLLAECYRNGRGVKQDYSEALSWYEKAANKNIVEAQYQLGYFYEYGLCGVKEDKNKSFSWYSKAAEQGHAEAQSKVAHWYYDKKDYSQSLAWYRKSAEQGNMNAQSYLGMHYKYGDGVSKDYNKAISWYKKAAEQGDRFSQNCVGDIYKEGGYGVTKDYKQAVYWYRMSAENGYQESQYELGEMYEKGLGVAQDYEQAVYWYRKAAEQKYSTNAKIALGRMYEGGKGVEKNYSMAMMWYKAAGDYGKKYYDNLAAQGYQEKPADPPLLAMIDGSLQFFDATKNNRIDAGEQCSVKFRVQNNGKGPAIGCEARVKLTGAKEGITVKTVTLPKVEPGKSCDVSIPITSNVNIQDGNVTMSIEVYEPNGWGVAPFDLTVATKAYEQPLMQVVDYNVASASGKIRKMEPFTLTFNLQNTKYGDAENVKVKVNLPANVFVMDGSAEVSFPLIKSGEAKPVTLVLAANNNYPTTDIPVNIDVKEKYGRFAENKQLNLALNAVASGSVVITAKDEPQRERKEIELAMLTAEVDRNIPTTSTKNPHAFVLIIANETYQQVASVPFAMNDGNIFREYCQKTLGVPEKHIHYVANATYNQIKSEVNWLKNITETFDDAQIILYYAGHGIPDEASRTAYLLPVDGFGSDVTTGYKLDDLYTALGQMPASKIIVFMDACFSGSKREEGMLASARGVALKAKSGVPQGNMVVFSAATGDETAYPNREKQHGLFTYYLLKKLQETEGNLSLQQLGDYIVTNVQQQSILLNSKRQTPCVIPSASLTSDWQQWTLK